MKSRATVPQRCLFACPFYKHHWAENKACLRYRMNRISDVRQHLRRTHMQAAQCSSCGLVFSDFERLNAHVEMKICQEAPRPPIVAGISVDQEQEILMASSNRQGRSNMAERWYEIWDIVFPGSTRPPSPYVDDSPIVQELMDLKETLFSSNEWEKLLPDSPRLLEAMDHSSRLENTRHIIDRFIKFAGDSGGAETRCDSGGEWETQAHTPKSPVEKTSSGLYGHVPPTEGLEQNRKFLDSSPQLVIPPLANESPLCPYEVPTVNTHSECRDLAVPSRRPQHSDFDLRAQPNSSSSQPSAPESDPLWQTCLKDGFKGYDPDALRNWDPYGPMGIIPSDSLRLRDENEEVAASTKRAMMLGPREYMREEYTEP